MAMERLKRWIGMHPVWSISLATVGVLLVTWLAYELAEALYQASYVSVRPWGEPAVRWSFRILPGVATAVAVIAIGIIRGRAGLSVATLAWSLPWSVPVVFGSMAVYWTQEVLRYPAWYGGMSLPQIVASCADETAWFWGPILAGQAAGLAIALTLVRRCFRTGRWETTAAVPLQKGVDER